MFTRQFIKDFIQNHKDQPSNWKFLPNFPTRYRNDKHQLEVDFNHNLTDICNIKIQSYDFDVNRLKLLERYRLKWHFLPFAKNKLDIPTTQTQPERFI